MKIRFFLYKDFTWNHIKFSKFVIRSHKNIYKWWRERFQHFSKNCFHVKSLCQQNSWPYTLVSRNDWKVPFVMHHPVMVIVRWLYYMHLNGFLNDRLPTSNCARILFSVMILISSIVLFTTFIIHKPLIFYVKSHCRCNRLQSFRILKWKLRKSTHTLFWQKFRENNVFEY